MNLTYFSANYIRSLAIAAILSLAMLFAFMPASVQASSGYDSPCVHRHKVIYGETLSVIAAYHGLPVHRLANANQLYNSSRIHAGQILCIPIRLVQSNSGHGHSGYGNKHAPPKHHHHHHHHHPNAHYVVQSGNASSEIAQLHGVSDHKLTKEDYTEHYTKYYTDQANDTEHYTKYYIDHEDRIRVGQ